MQCSVFRSVSCSDYGKELFYRVKSKHIQCTVFTDFEHTKLSPFQTLSLGFILKIFLKYHKFEPQHSYKKYSYRKKSALYILMYRLASVVNGQYSSSFRPLFSLA